MQWAVALSALVAVAVHYSKGRRPPNILEEPQTKTTLHILDDNIVQYLTHPSPSGGRQLFQDIREYNKHFKEIIHGFQERKFRFVRIAHVIYDKGGPNFMKLKIDPPLFYKVSGWTMTDMGELYHCLKATNRLWMDFKVTYEEVKTAVKGNWTQLKSTYMSTVAPIAKWNITSMFQDFAEASVEDKDEDEDEYEDEDEETRIPGTNETLVDSVFCANDFEFFGFYQHDTKFTPDNETDHLGEMENLNSNVRKMLEALEQQTKDTMKKLALEAIVLGQNVLNSAYMRFGKYANPERFAQYMTPEDYKTFLNLREDTRYCLEKIDSIFETLPGALM